MGEGRGEGSSPLSPRPSSLRVCWPRQIWPPSHGVSSTSATRRPLSAAVQAAASPAGPAPMTTTSKSARSAIGLYLHAFLAQRQATAAVLLAINCHTTFHADPHPAERTPRSAQNGVTES